MRDEDTTYKVDALSHVHQAIEAIEATITKLPETGDMLHHLTEVRKELAYEIFRT